MDTTDTPVAEKASGMDTNRKIMLGLVITLVVVVLGMYMWKSSAVSSVQKQLVEVQAQEAQARTELVERARQLHAKHDADALKRFSAPLAWAVRRELMASNLDQIDQYLTGLVQMQGFESALLANPEGKIVVATDRKKLAEAFSALYPADYLQAKDVMVLPTATGGLRAVVPIMGLNQQLGTLVVEYVSPAYTLQ